MLNLLCFDQKYIAYTLDLKRYLPRFLLATRPFPIQTGDAQFLIEPRSSDLFTIYEVYSDRGYFPKLIKFANPLKTVVDFGANIGVFSIWVAREFQPQSVIAVEMEAACFDRLVANIRLNNLEEMIHPVQAAIYDRSGVVGIRKIFGTPFFEVVPDHTAYKVPSFSFEAFLSHTGLDWIDLLKIDIEGAEKHLLTSENAALFRDRVGYILLETHSLNGFRAEHAISYLSGLGFHLAMTRTPYVLDRNYIIDACNPANLL